MIYQADPRLIINLFSATENAPVAADCPLQPVGMWRCLSRTLVRTEKLFEKGL